MQGEPRKQRKQILESTRDFLRVCRAQGEDQHSTLGRHLRLFWMTSFLQVSFLDFRNGADKACNAL